MLLAELNAEHRGPLSADLHRYHSIRWAKIRESDWTITEIADFAAAFPPDSATARAANPEEWALKTETFLLRDLEQGVRVLAWQQTEDGRSKRPKNYPALVPLTKAESEAQKPKSEYDVMSIDEANEFLGWDPP